MTDQALNVKSLLARPAFVLKMHDILEDQNVVLVKIQIENLPAINSQFGNHVSENLIKTVSNALLSVKEASFTAEISPALYAVMGLNWQHPKRLLEMIQNSIQEINRKNMFPFLVEVSIGATIPSVGASGNRNMQLWFEQANLAMLYSGRTGEPQVYQENTALDATIRDIFGRLSLQDSPPEGMYWVYQPINSVVDGSVFAYEALCRWVIPGLGSVSPEIFIPIAEETGAIENIDRWGLMSLEAAHDQLFQQGGHCVSFNLSAKTLESDHSFLELIKVILERNKDCGCELIVEMTETAVAQNRGRLLAQLHDLRLGGVKIAIDDFGSGLTSLSSLADVPCDYLKVDGSLLRIADGNMALGLLEISKKLADLLKAKVIVEGVETLEELNRVKEAGADYAQGWYFGQPIDARDFAGRE